MDLDVMLSGDANVEDVTVVDLGGTLALCQGTEDRGGQSVILSESMKQQLLAMWTGGALAGAEAYA